MRVGLLTTSFPRAAHDLAGSFVLGFARALASRGHTVEVLAPEPHERAYLEPPRDRDVSVRWVPYLRPRSLERTFYGAGVLDNLRATPLAALGLVPFSSALAASAALRRRDWDALVSHWALPCGLIAGELADGRPHLAVLHSADVALLERLPLRRTLARRIARGASALLFSSRDLRRRFLALLDALERGEVAARSHVCAMGIEPSEPSEAGEAAEQGDEPRARVRERLGVTGFTALSVSRLVPIKGLEHAIAAAAHAEVELVIAGDGPERRALAQRAEREGARVRFVGSIHGAVKRDWLRAADVFVVPSVVLPSGRTEGMPTALLEAMDHGLPVIASEVGGIPDVVRADNGVLVPPADVQRLAAALRALSEPRIRARLARGARATAALYHWRELAPRLDALLFPGRQPDESADAAHAVEAARAERLERDES